MITRRDLLKLIVGVPFLSALSLEIAANLPGYDNGVYSIKSQDYIIGVGNSPVAWSEYNTDLQGNLRAYTRANSITVDDEGNLHFLGEFGLNEANFRWEEVALFVRGRCFRRRNRSMGIKCWGQIWEVDYTLQFNEPGIYATRGGNRFAAGYLTPPKG